MDMREMNIGICDDDGNWLLRAERIIREFADRRNFSVTVECFCDKKELLDFDERALDVLFMDIELDEDNGIELVKEVNRLWKNCQIVYLTNYLFYAVDIYQTEHIYFVLKEQFEQRVEEVFEKIGHELEQADKKLLYSVIGRKQVLLAPQDILYFERVRRVTMIETKSGTYEIWDKLDQIIEGLPALDFVRCHISYIVYLPAVLEVETNAFLMKNGTRIPISRGYAKAVKQAFMEWALTQSC